MSAYAQKYPEYTREQLEDIIQDLEESSADADKDASRFEFKANNLAEELKQAKYVSSALQNALGLTDTQCRLVEDSTDPEGSLKREVRWCKDQSRRDQIKNLQYQIDALERQIREI